MRTLLRRRTLLAGAAVFALAAAGFAIAGPGPASTSQVSASFAANTLVKSHAQTCTGTNNDSYQVTDAIFAGTAVSNDSHLAGPLTIHVRSIYDATTNLGSLTADVRIAGTATPAPDEFHGHLTAVNVNGTVQGYLTGEENGGGHVEGNLTVSFSATGGFGSSTTPGELGAGGAADTAIVTSGGCDANRPNNPNDPKQDNPGPEKPHDPRTSTTHH